MKYFISFLFLFCSYILFSQELANNYIDQYREIAISEMNRTGIPASIKLAQGLLESDWGRSNLAREANNHFGIKCGNNWNGDTFYKLDDDRNAFGKIIESCFRAYRHAEESYIAHSDFLVNQEDRYGFLFEYETTEYKAWAKGLKKAGYATDPAYPKKLITIIEKYELYQYDQNQTQFASTSHSKVQQNGNPGVRTDGIKLEGEADQERKYSYSFNNDVRMVLTNGEQSIADIAEHYNIDVALIMEYNDHAYPKDKILLANERIYLEKKKFQYSGRSKFHEVRPGDKMQSIAQHYGIQLDALYVRNRMPLHAEILPGELVQLKGLRTSSRPEFKANVYEGRAKGKASEWFSYYFTEKGYDTTK